MTERETRGNSLWINFQKKVKNILVIQKIVLPLYLETEHDSFVKFNN